MEARTNTREKKKETSAMFLKFSFFIKKEESRHIARNQEYFVFLFAVNRGFLYISG